MKYPNRWSVAVALAAFFIACSPTLAQWQVPDHAVPIGRGTGTGFKSAAPSTAGNVLTDMGASADPAFRPASVVAVALTADASTAYSATHATANSSALAAVLATGRCAFIPYNANGYSFAGSITVNSGDCIQGEGQVLVKSQSTTSFLNVVGFGFPVVQISNLHIDMTGSGASSTAIRFDTSGGVVYGVRISAIYFTNCVEAIGDNGTPGGGGDYIVDIGIDDVRAAFTRGVQIHIRNSRGFFHLNQVQVDHTSNVGAVTWNGIQFDFFAGLEMNAVDVTGPVTGTYQSGVHGIYLAGSGTSAAVWMNRVNVDTTTGNGIRIEGTTYAWLNNLDVNYNSGNQVVLATCNKVEIVNSFAGGAVGKPDNAAGAAGWQFSSCANVHISNTSTENNTGAGFYLNNTTDTLLSNIRSTGNGTYGVIEDGTSDRNLLSSGVLNTNTTANLLLIGAQSRALHYEASGSYIPAPVNAGGTGLASGTSGGVPCYTASTTIASSAALASGLVVVGGGAGVCPSTIANGQLPATATNDNASAGKVGEYVSSTVASGSAVSLTTNTQANVTSISLTAGDWDVSGIAQFTGNTSTTVSSQECSISTTSATLDYTGGKGNAITGNPSPYNQIAASSAIGCVIPPVRVSLSGTTTHYLVARSIFAASTSAVYGVLRARRVR